MKRTDIHRPGAIVPADYAWLHEFGRLVYVPASKSITGETEEEWEGMDEALDIYESAGVYVHGERGDEGAILRCDLCGARYAFGSLFRHEPTGDVISVGHDCADAMQLAYDVAVARGIRDRAVRLRKTRLERIRRFAELMHWARENRADLAALKADHRIVKDIRARLVSKPRWGLSDRQLELVRKLHAEPREEEILVPAAIVEGKRQTVEGTIVSCKWHESDYGGSFKITVKVETEAGVWLAWGTLPSAVEDAYQAEVRDLPRWDEHGNTIERSLSKDLRGRRIKFDARLKPGREEHFALFSRPTKAELLCREPEVEVVES